MSLAVLGQSSLFRAGLVSLLAALGFERIADAATLADLKELNPNQGDFDILLVHLPSANVKISPWVREIKASLPRTKVVFLSATLDLKLMSECFAGGASGYLLENLSCDALKKSLALVQSGEKVFPSELARVIADLAAPQRAATAPAAAEALELSHREIEVLGLLARGCPNKVIAARLGIAASTVRAHLKQILRKTHAVNRTQAVLWAARRGLVRSAK
jgi:two-component system, NarL family, nitrate/nitrite response regulator NarL